MTRTTTRRRASVALAGVAALALALTGCVTVNTGGSGGGMGGMGDGMDDLPAGVNRADAMFAMMMIPHHEQAVEMSELMLGRDDIDAEIVDLAEQIIAAQAPEIELMEGWLDDWGVPSMGGAMGDGHGGHGDGGPGGMMSDDDLDKIAEAQGDEAELLYLEGMIEHHEGAIDMAQDVLDDGESTEVAELAETIITTQQDEIDDMRDLIAARS